MLGYNSQIFFALCCLATLVNACSKDPEAATLKTAKALMIDEAVPSQEQRLQQALNYVNDRLQEQPGSLKLLRLKVLIMLKSERPESAALALRFLPEGDPVMGEALIDRDPVVRLNAAVLIAEKPEIVSYRSLLQGIEDSNPNVRALCARAIGELKNPSATRKLFQLLGDDNRLVKAEAIVAIAKIGDQRAAGWFINMIRSSDDYLRQLAEQALFDVACDENRATLIHALNKANQQQLNAINLALAKLGEKGVLKAITNLVAHPNPTIRHRLASVLGNYHISEATNSLSILVRDSEDPVRLQALKTLEHFETIADPKANSEASHSSSQ